MSNNGSQAFPSLFGEIRAEVMDFIENGAGPSSAGTAAVALSAEGRFYHAKLQAMTELASADTDVTTDGAIANGVAKEGAAQQAFLTSIAPWAKEAGQRLGVSGDIIAAHAALESGWGRHPLRKPDGSDSHNLFGVKAGRNWKGEAIDARTTEYEGGAAQAKIERFRSFPDQAGAFQDFVRLLQDSPRYQGALNTGNDARAYAQGLVRGGYATDPAYADKLVRLATRIQSRE